MDTRLSRVECHDGHRTSVYAARNDRPPPSYISTRRLTNPLRGSSSRSPGTTTNISAKPRDRPTTPRARGFSGRPRCAPFSPSRRSPSTLPWMQSQPPISVEPRSPWLRSKWAKARHSSAARYSRTTTRPPLRSERSSTRSTANYRWCSRSLLSNSPADHGCLGSHHFSRSANKYRELHGLDDSGGSPPVKQVTAGQ